MGSLTEVHHKVLQKFMSISEQLQKTEKELSELKSSQRSNISARISNLEEQLEKIDDHMLRIEAFRKLAEKNLESQNVLTIEAPPGYRVNLNRLRRWAMMIDPTSSNDPYAQRVYVVAKCDVCFLKQKKEEFAQRIEQLKLDQSTGMTAELSRLEEQMEGFAKELNQTAASEEMMRFAQDVIRENLSFCYEETPRLYANVEKKADTLSMGAYAFPLKIPDGQQNIFGRFYDKESKSVWIPARQSTDREFALSVLCSPARAKQLDKAVQNLLLQILERYPAGKNKIYVLDGVRYNSAALGSLRQLEDSFAVAPVPRNPEQLTETLEQIVSSFSDMDDILELRDSVIEFNETAQPDKQMARMTLVVFGWPDAYGGRDKEYLKRIMTNYERYGISFISIVYRNHMKRENEKDVLPEYAAQNAARIHMFSKETSIQMDGGEEKPFQWYMIGDTLKEEYARSLRANKVERLAVGNEYLKRHAEFSDMPDYGRAYKRIELPFGIDSRDREHSVSFENENFAAYLVGASRSGKSTLLHTLIAGLIRNYHPDNLELWLADFKQLEFRKYMKHCPPHVKYILLDESTELVYDLIDKLTEKMRERQLLFSRLGVERIDQLDPYRLDKPVPVIFVILDEFSMMSQAIAESQTYRLRLQNLLAKGAALGLKFLFASQTFTTGVTGLTPTARAQIQQRIAMKGTKEEISETLELSMNLKTEQVRNWIDALPPHYALVKHRISADELPQVNRVLVMYFPDHAQIDSLIDKINESMTRSTEYKVSDTRAYVNKKAVFVDGNSYHAFPMRQVTASVAKEKKKNSFTGDERFLALGVPRLMSKLKLITISRETRENILLIGRMMEQDCSASVLTSAMRSFLMQNGQVHVWAHGKNLLYRRCREEAWKGNKYAGVMYSEDMEQICSSIRDLKEKIQKKQTGNELIVLIGMDRICADFEFVDTKGSSSNGLPWPGLDPSLEVSTPEEERLFQMTLSDDFGDGLEDEPENQDGKHAADKQEARNEILPKEVPTISDAYNAGSDLQYIVTQGSRLGYHFLLFLNSYADLKTTSLRLEWFRHRMAFQISAEDSREIFHNKIAGSLPEHVCQYYDTMSQHSFRPYLHQGICWDGWEVGKDGRAVNLFE